MGGQRTKPSLGSPRRGHPTISLCSPHGWSVRPWKRGRTREFLPLPVRPRAIRAWASTESVPGSRRLKLDVRIITIIRRNLFRFTNKCSYFTNERDKDGERPERGDTHGDEKRKVHGFLPSEWHCWE